MEARDISNPSDLLPFFLLLLLQNNQLILLHLSFAKAASYLEAHPAYVKIRTTSMKENKYLHDLYFF